MQQWFMKQPKLRFLLFFCLAQAVFLGLFLGFISVFKDKLPAPHLSSSESFNEKARWLHKLQAKSCDILVLGSSMALNNIDWAAIQANKPQVSVVNASSWGLTLEESAAMLNTLAPSCKPRLIVLVAYFGDFDYVEQKSINWRLFKDYLQNTADEFIYLQTANLNYYLSTFLRQKRMVEKGNAIYQSLLFDKTGTVLLNCENFQIEAGRWQGYIKLQNLKAENVKLALQGLSLIEESAKAYHSHLTVIVPPLRPAAEQKSTEIGAEQLWDEVAASVRDAGGDFMRPGLLVAFKDADFADFAHLNACGATKMAEAISASIINNPALSWDGRSR